MTYTSKELERLSSAFTLSDMELFIFPELFYPLVMANIMSPVIWKWRDDEWFRNIDKKNLMSRINRVKQYIIQNYVFNLDLETWGLTNKNTELSRFSEFFDHQVLENSNALFGYEGDKYYFSIDIRKHFGLDKYDSDTIPYWKTETVEAMEAFRYRDGFTTGAGECVSLSALYAAALFIVAKIPLERIFVIATPLHSQNFVTMAEGVLTNNRRIVTKNMWFNGTSLSTKARRALENENVTIISHISGYIHIAYPKATIDKSEYDKFTSCLNSYLNVKLSPEILINFLRFKPVYKKLFQYQSGSQFKKVYISLDKMFEYEHSSRFNITSESRSSLLKEIDGDEFSISPLENKIILNEIEEYLIQNSDKTFDQLRAGLTENIDIDDNDLINNMLDDVASFISTNPKLPGIDKTFVAEKFPRFSRNDNRDEILKKVSDFSNYSDTAKLALYAYRDMSKIDWVPFIKASIERNPVSTGDLYKVPQDQIFDILSKMENVSIYDGTRLAQPDEVWNFRRGDGIEKAIVMANVLATTAKSLPIVILVEDREVVLTCNKKSFRFISEKSFRKKVVIEKGYYKVESI